MTDIRRAYNNSPIVEAVCEFRFDPEPEWDLTIPGLVYERLKDDFPERRVRGDFPVEIQERFGQEIVKQMERMAPLMQFYSGDESALVQIGQHLLGISHLRPYSTWEQFQKMIRKALEAYQEVANPTTLQRLGLRYINRIDIAETAINLEDYFNIYPNVPNLNDERPMSGWLQRVEIPFVDVNALLTIHVGSIKQQGHDGSSYMLDLDFSTQNELPVIDRVFEWLDNAHEQIEDMFESSITDQTRKLFNEKVPS